MSVHVSGADATQWASRVAETMPRTMIERHPLDTKEIIVRLSDLRGAVEAMRGVPASVNIGESRSTSGQIRYGDPVGYRGMRFLLMPSRASR
jgi:hypothetical protein